MVMDGGGCALACGALMCVPWDAVGKITGAWSVPDVQAPHDMAVIAAPMRLAGKERPVALLIGETRPSGSRLQKYILLPEGGPPVSLLCTFALPRPHCHMLPLLPHISLALLGIWMHSAVGKRTTVYNILGCGIEMSMKAADTWRGLLRRVYKVGAGTCRRGVAGGGGGVAAGVGAAAVARGAGRGGGGVHDDDARDAAGGSAAAGSRQRCRHRQRLQPGHIPSSQWPSGVTQFVEVSHHIQIPLMPIFL